MSELALTDPQGWINLVVFIIIMAFCYLIGKRKK